MTTADATLTMDTPFTHSLLDDAPAPLVGTAVDRVDGPLKVSGGNRYAAEHFPRDLAHGVLVRAPFGKGRVTRLDADAARAMPGVLAVIADDRLIRNGGNFAGAAAPVQGVREVVYFGQSSSPKRSSRPAPPPLRSAWRTRPSPARSTSTPCSTPPKRLPTTSKVARVNKLLAVNRDLGEYHVPVHADIPAVDVLFLPERDPVANPLLAKGVGELGVCGAGAAVANAIHNATGLRVRDYPITLDKLLSALPPL